MNDGPHRDAHIFASVFNLPNQLTMLRLLLAVVMFGAIASAAYYASFVLFLIAASTDWLDGYCARRYGQVTTLGRILDPFADKVIICGAFIFLLAIPEMLAVPLGLRAWMVVVIVGREILVTALRSFIEERGSDFSANWSGKIKMVLQCVAAAAGLFYLARWHTSDALPLWARLVLVGSIWLAVVATVWSGVGYVLAAIRLLRK